MASDISVGKSPNRAMQEAQEDFSERKQQLIEENERKLNKLQSSYKHREQKILEAGEATINHIKKSTDVRVDTARQEAQARLERENEGINQNYENLKQRTLQQTNALDRQLSSRRANVAKNLRQIDEEQAATIQQKAESTREFMQSQQKQTAEMAKKNAAEMERMQQTGHEKLLLAKRKNEGEAEKVTSEHSQTLANLKETHARTYERTKEETQKRLQSVREDTDKKVTNEREQSNKTLSEIQHKFRSAAAEEQRNGEGRLVKLDSDLRNKFEAKQRRAIETEDVLEKQYQREINRVQNMGETDLKNRQMTFEERTKQQEAFHQAEFAEQEALYMAREKDLKTRNEKLLQTQAATYEKNLAQMQKDFKATFAKNDETHKQSLDNQKNVFLRELYKQKSEFQSKFNAADSRKEDPFYSTRDLGATLKETTGAYVLNARIPEYEKDSVDVRVKDDRVILSARRANEVAFNKDNVKASTNTYQTFRQEFKLDIPVAQDNIVKNLKEDGSIEVLIPKRGYSNRV